MVVEDYRLEELALNHINAIIDESSGGLALMWRQECNLEVQSFSPNHINAIITESWYGFKLRFSGVYGHP